MSDGGGGPVRFGLWYDFRNPSAAGRSHESFYAEVLDQIAYAEELGFGSVWLTEHHFVADGYTPSPLVILGTVAARTREMLLSTSLMLLPLADPVRIAEDAAALAILSGGRFDLGIGVGYRQLEFEAFKRRVSHRPSLMEEGIEIIRRAWAGESMHCAGKRFSLPDVRMAPLPTRPPRLLIGAMTEPGIERAARLGDGFLSTQNAHIPQYLEAIQQVGKDPAQAQVHAGQWVIIDEDPEATWARIGDHALYQLNEYITWGAFGPPDQVPRFPDRDAIVAGGAYQLWDGPTAVAELGALMRAHPQIRDIYFWAQLPGESVESGTRRIEYFADQVAPRLAATVDAPAPTA
ncbi:MAG TPA: LLM class flavin-dependent oxidoreductase [Solirubrobacteraceae bacterium]|nr:LLM class flavin-dependent oxidoreductase [Solirubrobacteraceae bacterium]